MKYTTKTFALTVTAVFAILVCTLLPSCSIGKQLWEVVKVSEITLRYTDPNTGITYTEPINGKIDGTLDIQSAKTALEEQVGKLEGGGLVVVTPSGETPLVEPKGGK